MRIIAGELRSRRLKSPEGMDTRPTADRVKEALFSILAGHTYGARVLDLYAGSGALALEALSRGADSAVLCDCGRDACRVIRENIAALGLQERAKLLPTRDAAALEALHRAGDGFDLIFLDPPYRMDTAPVSARIVSYGLLRGDGVLVAEHSRSTPPQTPDGLMLYDRREYGAAGLSFYRLTKEEGP